MLCIYVCMKNISNMEHICRICLSNSNENNVVDRFNNFSEISQKIFLCTSIRITQNDGFPQFMCKNCLENLNVAYTFRQVCISSDCKLRTTRNKVEDETITIANQTLLNNENGKTLSIEYSPQHHMKCKGPSIASSYITNNVVERNIFGQQNGDSQTHFQCTFCKKMFQFNHTLSLHLLKVHKPKVDNEIKHNCSECSVDFLCRKEYNNHLNEFHSEKRNEQKTGYQCDVCGKVLKYRVDLMQHLRRHTGDRPFKCGLCDKSYITKSSLTKHIAKHSNQKAFECNLCFKTFLHQSNLKVHMGVHSKEKKFACNLCGKLFKYNRTLMLHIKIHTNERNYPCDQCDKAFVNRFDLGRHLKRHETKKAIENGTYNPRLEPPKLFNLQQCEKCGRVCNSKGDLRKHMRCHSNERPFQCSFCKKGFKGSSSMRAHERTHTKVRPYVCQQCGRNFSQSSNLRIHERLHTGLRPYKCENCNRLFNRKRDLITHQKKHILENIDNKM